jgi:hypothetical protein
VVDNENDVQISDNDFFDDDNNDQIPQSFSNLSIEDLPFMQNNRIEIEKAIDYSHKVDKTIER